MWGLLGLGCAAFRRNDFDFSDIRAAQTVLANEALQHEAQRFARIDMRQWFELQQELSTWSHLPSPLT